MIKKLSLIFVIFCSLPIFLTSCKVNWFGEQIDTPWYAVAIPVAVLAIAILIIGKLTFSKKIAGIFPLLVYHRSHPAAMPFPVKIFCNAVSPRPRPRSLHLSKHRKIFGFQ